MQGEPIPGEHWIEVDLQEVFSVEKIVIDWEQAFSDQWSIMVINFFCFIFNFWILNF